MLHYTDVLMNMITMEYLIKYINRRFYYLSLKDFLYQDFGITIWLKNGAPAHKLVLGIPLFARSFLLARSDQNELHSPTIGNGTAGPFTRSPGFLSYFEVKKILVFDKIISILFDK